MRTTTRITFIAVACLAAVGLAGCSANSTTSSSPAATQSDTAAPAPAPATTGSSAPSGSTTESPSTGTGTGTGSGVAACTSTHLRASIAANAGGGAAGSTYVSLVLTNTGTASCTLQGWPGVSFVGDGNGTQIGQAAAFDRTSPHPTVTLAPAGTATSTLRIVQAGNYSSADCTPIKADGFRVYPPGQKASIFASKSGLTACAAKSVSLLTVSGLQ